jgi:hypothetical protein
MRRSANILIVAVLVAASTACAGVVGTATVSYTGNFTDGTMTIGGVRNVQTYGGIYLLNKTAGTGDGALIPNGTIDSFCIDVFQNVNSNSEVYLVQTLDSAPITGGAGPMGLAKANDLRELWGRYFSQVQANAQKAEAFSACVWEIVYESDPNWDVTSGAGFYCTGLATGMPTLANSWLASLNGTGPMADLRALTSQCHQDFICEIPEPAAISLLTLGALFVAGRRMGRKAF